MRKSTGSAQRIIAPPRRRFVKPRRARASESPPPIVMRVHSTIGRTSRQSSRSTPRFRAARTRRGASRAPLSSFEPCRA